MSLGRLASRQVVGLLNIIVVVLGWNRIKSYPIQFLPISQLISGTTKELIYILMLMHMSLPLNCKKVNYFFYSWGVVRFSILL